MERLKGGMVRSMAAKSSVALGMYNPKPVDVPSLIPAQYWNNVQPTGVNFWGSGEAKFYFRRGPLGDSDMPTTIRCFGIRLDPKALRETLPTPRPKEPPQPEIPTEQKPATKKLRLPDPFLMEWWTLYRKAYPNDLGEAHAIKSAEGMFHGHSIARERIRALRGPQKRGPKVKDRE